MLNIGTIISQNLRDKLSRSDAVPQFQGLRKSSSGYCFALWKAKSQTDPNKRYYVQQHLESQSVDGTGLLAFRYSCECKASSTKHCCIHCLEVRREAEKSFHYFMRSMVANLPADHLPKEPFRSEFEKKLDQSICSRIDQRISQRDSAA